MYTTPQPVLAHRAEDISSVPTFLLFPLHTAIGQHLEGSPSHGGHLLFLGLFFIGAGLCLAAQAAEPVHELHQATTHQTLLLTPAGEIQGGINLSITMGMQSLLLAQ